MQRGTPTHQDRREAIEAIRFQQSLLRLGAAGHGPASKKPPQRSTDVQSRQLAAWAAQLGATGTYQ